MTTPQGIAILHTKLAQIQVQAIQYTMANQKALLQQLSMLAKQPSQSNKSTYTQTTKLVYTDYKLRLTTQARSAKSGQLKRLNKQSAKELQLRYSGFRAIPIQQETNQPTNQQRTLQNTNLLPTKTALPYQASNSNKPANQSGILYQMSIVRSQIPTRPPTQKSTHGSQLPKYRSHQAPKESQPAPYTNSNQAMDTSDPTYTD